MNNTFYPIFNINGTSYQWTDKADDEHFTIIVNGIEQQIGKRKIGAIDGSFGIFEPRMNAVICDCKGVAYDGIAKLEGYDNENHDKKIFAIVKYPTLQEVYNDETLLKVALSYSQDLGEQKDKGFNICASPYDILMYAESFSNFSFEYVSKEEYDKVKDPYYNIATQLNKDFNELKAILLGMDLLDAVNLLGSGWIINKSANDKSQVVLTREDKGCIQLFVDTKNKVDNVFGFFTQTNEKVFWQSYKTFSDFDLQKLLMKLADYTDKASEAYFKFYMKELAHTKLFADAIGKVVDVEADGTIKYLPNNK